MKLRILPQVAALALCAAVAGAQAAPTFGELSDGWLGGENPYDFSIEDQSSGPQVRLAMRTSVANTPSSSDGTTNPDLVTYTVLRDSAWTLDLSIYAGEGNLLDTSDAPAFWISLDIDWGALGGTDFASFDVYTLGILPSRPKFQNALGFADLFAPGSDALTADSYVAKVRFETLDRTNSAELTININVADAQNIPEPGSLALAGLALGGLLVTRRRTG
jgi:hypothetical protein